MSRPLEPEKTTKTALRSGRPRPRVLPDETSRPPETPEGIFDVSAEPSPLDPPPGASAPNPAWGESP